MAGLGLGALGGAGGVLAAEVCAPLLLLCWLCCWPDDDRSDSSSEQFPQKAVVADGNYLSLSGVRRHVASTLLKKSRSRHRSGELFSRRLGSSAVSLHLPSTSGNAKQSLSAHRSHEEIRSRRKSQHEAREPEPEARYHSAPSVIDEVLHRRDWERSTKDLYIPLKSDQEFSNASDASDKSNDDDDERPHETLVRTCKKHYTNIKSSRKKENKELLNEDIKDQDVTEGTTNFYIGDTGSPNETSNDINVVEKTVATKFKAKEAKQCLNECIRSKDRRHLVPLTESQVTCGFELEEMSDAEVDRSGAMHHSIESRSSLYNTHTIPAPPPSVEAVGYSSEGEGWYLEESGAAGVWRVWRAPATTPVLPVLPAGWSRARHASAGDVLAPALRPQSGALSESDLDFSLEGCDSPPPAYHEVLAAHDRKETAI